MEIVDLIRILKNSLKVLNRHKKVLRNQDHQSMILIVSGTDRKVDRNKREFEAKRKVDKEQKIIEESEGKRYGTIK